MLYKVGSQLKVDGHFFDTLVVDAKEEGAVDKALDDGWCMNTPDALEKVSDEPDHDDGLQGQESSDDVTSGNREALEKRAKELEVGFNSRTTDEVLEQRIKEASPEG